MDNILIIGAGALGSRHLQGVLKVDRVLNVYCVDPSIESLKIAEERAKEISSLSRIEFFQSLDELPYNEFEVVIIATNSHVRERIIFQLFSKNNVKHLILEKVLFQDIEAYERVSNILKTTNTKVWVNHPRRMVSYYKDLQKLITESNEKIIFNVVGGNWGLGCNGLHFIDLLTYITNDKVSSIEEDWLDNVIQSSKREGFIEFTGTIKGITEKGHVFTITSFDGEASPVTITIGSSSNRWIIEEGNNAKVIFFSKKNSFERLENNFIIDFQSNFTTTLITSLLKDASCNLPTYDEAAATHLFFIKNLLKKYTEITNTDTKLCPIT